MSGTTADPCSLLAKVSTFSGTVCPPAHLPAALTRSARPPLRAFARTACALSFVQVAPLVDGENTVRLTQLGRIASAGFWGLEHSAIVQGAAAHAQRSGDDCVVVEAGAHQGTLALLASQLGCVCFAFEAVLHNIDLFRVNAAATAALPRPVHLVAGYIGQAVSRRIDEIVKQNVTLLKMDIDGPDLLAMRGADALFDRRAVRFVNLEFGRGKQAESGVEYLRQLDAWGFEPTPHKRCKQPPHARRARRAGPRGSLAARAFSQVCPSLRPESLSDRRGAQKRRRTSAAKQAVLLGIRM